MLADVGGEGEPSDEMMAREPEPGPVGNAVEEDGSQQKLLAVDEHIKQQMEEGAREVADEGQAWPSHGECHQRAHQFDGMERENEPMVAMSEVVTQKLGWAGPTPLPLDRQVVQIVIDVDHKRPREAAGCQFRRACDAVTSAAENYRRGEVTAGPHGCVDLNRGSDWAYR